MKEDAYKILKTAIEEHREQLLVSRQTCLGILRDFGGREHPEVNLLADAVEEDIPDRLLRSQPITQDIIDSLAGSFAATKFLDAQASKFAVSSWADALGVFDFTLGIAAYSSAPVEPKAHDSKKTNSEYYQLEDVTVSGIPDFDPNSKRIIIKNNTYDYYYISELEEKNRILQTTTALGKCRNCEFPVVESMLNRSYFFVSGVLLPIFLYLVVIIFSSWWIILGLIIFLFIYLICLGCMTIIESFSDELRCPRCHSYYKKAN